MHYRDVLERAGFTAAELTAGSLAVCTPIDGARIASLRTSSTADAAAAIERATSAFRTWRSTPAPRRGELVRLFGDELRRAKGELGALVTLESGKILQEGLGEVQEM